MKIQRTINKVNFNIERKYIDNGMEHGYARETAVLDTINEYKKQQQIA